MPKRESKSPRELATEDISAVQSPLAMKIPKVSPVTTESEGADIQSNAVIGKVSFTEKRYARKRKRLDSGEDDDDSSDSDASTSTSSNDDAGAKHSQTFPGIEFYKFGISFDSPQNLQAYMDSLTEDCDALNLRSYGKLSGDLDDPVSDEERRQKLSDIAKNHFLNISVAKKSLADIAAEVSDTSDSESASNKSCQEDDDSNAEDNWRNEYPDEDDFDNDNGCTDVSSCEESE